MDLSRDFREFVGCCVAREVRFLIDRGLIDFGLGSLGVTAADFGEPDVVVQLGVAPQRIDLLTSIDGVEFEDCWSSRVAVDIAGTAVPFIDVDHLVINKRASGRLQDLADVEALTDVGFRSEGHRAGRGRRRRPVPRRVEGAVGA